MRNNLEETVSVKDWTISNIFIPLKIIRHLPTILKIPDPSTRYFEASANGFVVGFQIELLYDIYKAMF